MRHPVLSVAGALAAALALAAPAAAPASVTPPQLASGPSPFAACTIGGPGTVFVNAEVEPWVAVNPTNPDNVVGAFQQDRWNNGGAHGLVNAISFDGGQTWTESFAHFSKCAGGTPENGGDYDRSSDPWVSFGPDGKLYQISLSVSADQVTSAILTSTSSDGGLTWTEPFTVLSETSNVHFNDKESITADPNIAGRAYAVWDRSRFPSDSASLTALQNSAAFRGSPFFSMTTDGGETWSPARRIGPNQNLFTIGNQIAVLPDGTLVDVFHFGKGSGADEPNESMQGLIRSTDGGQRWSQPIEIADNPVVRPRDPDTGTPLRTGADIGGSIPDVAVDPNSGKLYAVWEDSRFSGTHDDIALSSSTDGGRNWTEPVKVNQTPNGAIAVTPSVDVLPDGTVGVTYYDLRNNTPDPATLPTDYFAVHSSDGGRTWDPEERITPASFDYATAPNARGFFIGDYQGLANDGSAFKSFFIQTNSGDTANRTDAFASTIKP
jgi:hypothetical protein